MRILAVLLLLLAGACAPRFPEPATAIASPRIDGADRILVRDGTVLAIERWGSRHPKAVVVALHGMNDYAHAFADPAQAFAGAGLVTIAYDQRGFGRTPPVGFWPGAATMVRDLDDVIAATRAAYPGVPVFVLGESMGASVAALWAEQTGGRDVNGIILTGPALWGWKMLNPLYGSALSMTARLFPSKSFTGGGLEIWPSDNIDMLRALSRDPLVIKATRADAIYGLVGLMDDAYAAVPRIGDIPILVLYGRHDQVIPRRPVREALGRRLKQSRLQTRFVYYPNGYHMLLRDRARAIVDRDIIAWIGDPAAPLPSGQEDSALDHLRRD